MLFEQAYDPARAVQAAWQLLKRAPVTLGLGALLPILAQYVLVFGLEFLMLPFVFTTQHSSSAMPPGLLVWMVLCAGLGVLFFGFQTWYDVGYARAAGEVRATQAERFSVLLSGAQRFVPLLLARPLLGLAGLLLYGVVAAPFVAIGVLASTSVPHVLVVLALICFSVVIGCVYVYVLLGLQFVTPLVALEGCGPVDAIGRSWSMASGRRGKLIVFWLCLVLIGFAGLLACGIGMLVAFPLIETMRLEAFLALKQPLATSVPEPQGWSSTPPPPPPPQA